MSSVLNFNVGVLGHVDSGKTTLAKVLSNVASTASFDKNPQSKERGITIDLGFSSFCVKCPNHINSVNRQYEILQFTLVDCPGHASLIRTIIGGSQIIDLMLLVIDATKGIQAQTAECLVIGEITCEYMLVVVNKIDLLPSDKRPSLLEKMTKKISKTFEKTRFSNIEIISVAAKPGGGVDDKVEPIGIKSLVNALCQHSYLPKRTSEGPFIFSVDHCFLVKGQGTIMTGTVIKGSVTISDVVEIPLAKITRKVKSIQIFKAPVDKAMQGDRVGLCVTNFNTKLLERGIVCSPGCMDTVDAVIARVHKICYYKGNCSTKSKFHITIMHETVMAKCSFFGAVKGENDSKSCKCDDVYFDFNEDYIFLNELEITNNTDNDTCDIKLVNQYALLEFQKPVILNKNCLLIGSKLDTDIHLNACRLAFYGQILEYYTSKQCLDISLPSLKVYKMKHKKGIVDRMNNKYEIIGRSLFKKDTNIQLFIGLKIHLSNGEEGIIESAFGQSGKVKIKIPEGLQQETIIALNTNKKKSGLTTAESSHAIEIVLNFKKYIYDSKKGIVQT